MTEPLVSVVICVRDGGKYIAQALDSVRAQQLDNLEIIVVDDGSADDSADLAERHAMRPRVIRRPALGHPAALNEGMRQSTGRYLALLDCDDIWPADRLKSMLAAFEVHEPPDIVFGRMVNTDLELRPVGEAGPARLLTAALVRRTAALAVGDFRTDVAHGSAVDWISRATALGLRFSAVDELVLFRRVHGENVGIRERRLASQDMLRVIRDHHARQKK
ncbi:MAG: glycosyltransferase family A protein [Devosia sp.]|nr:glycosyltransferase family A protein [Devosia sp.]